MLWSGSIATIPTGYVLCDGDNGTPDLTDRFIFGAGSLADPGDSGGDEETLFGTGSSVYQKTSGYVDGTSPGVRNDYTQTNPVQAHKHEFMPVYYALAYIMKS